MKSETKKAFQKAAAEFEADRTEQQRIQEKRVTERQTFEAGWREARDKVIIPALTQIREEALAPAGWTSAIRKKDDAMSVTLELYKGEMHALGTTQRPSITFVADQSSPRINIVAQSRTQGGGEGQTNLSAVTEEFVQAKVLKFFQRVASGS